MMEAVGITLQLIAVKKAAGIHEEKLQSGIYLKCLDLLKASAYLLDSLKISNLLLKSIIFICESRELYQVVCWICPQEVHPSKIAEEWLP